MVVPYEAFERRLKRTKTLTPIVYLILQTRVPWLWINAGAGAGSAGQDGHRADETGEVQSYSVRWVVGCGASGRGGAARAAHYQGSPA